MQKNKKVNRKHGIRSKTRIEMKNRETKKKKENKIINVEII